MLWVGVENLIQISKIEKKFLNDVIPPRALDRRFQEDWTRDAREKALESSCALG